MNELEADWKISGLRKLGVGSPRAEFAYHSYQNFAVRYLGSVSELGLSFTHELKKKIPGFQACLIIDPQTTTK